MRVSMPAPRAAAHQHHGSRRWGRAAAIAVGLIATPLVVGAPAANADTVIGGCTIVDNPTPANFTNCPGVNLEKSNLDRINLAYAKLPGARLYFTKLQDANLTGADLTGAELGSADLSSANLTDADLTGSRMNAANALAANLTNANLTDTSLRYARLGNTTLTGADFTRADIQGALLDDTVLIPSYQRAIADAATGKAVVTWPTPPDMTGTTFETCDRPSGSSFPVGNTVVRCTVRTSNGSSASGTFIVQVDPHNLPRVSGNPGEATVGKFYTYQFDVVGDPRPDITTTSTPPGLTLSKSGVLSGTPTAAGTYSPVLIAVSEVGETYFEARIVVRDNDSAGNGASGSLGNLFGSS